MLAPPPWTFPNARVLYQLSFVPVTAARAVTPTSGLTLLSLFGWTLGGVFVVDWAESPIGPYREVAVLSGLVARGLSIGAWASHIVVTTPVAVESGRDLFGLPTNLGSIEFEAATFTPSLEAEPPSLAEEAWEAAAAIAVVLKTAVGAASPGVAEPAERLRRPPSSRGREVFDFESDVDVRVRGWAGSFSCPAADQAEDCGLAVSLPSFSGRLPAAAAGTTTPLLRYPLSLGPARRVRLRPAVPTRAAPGVSEPLRAVLGGPSAFPCIQVDRVRIVAGAPAEINE